jgi:SulP family sulfate permease
MASFIAVIVLAAALVFGAGFLAFIPKMLIGGLLIYLGLSFMLEWVYTAFFKLTKLEYALVLLILSVVVLVGFLEGILVGIVASFVLFAINYSLSHKTQKGLNAKSIIPLDTSLLNESSSTLVLEPKGYLFFGTAAHFIEGAKKEIAKKAGLTDLNLNFAQVIGIDATALECLVEILDFARTKNITVQFTSLHEALEPQFKRVGLLGYVTVSERLNDVVLLMPQASFTRANYSNS